MTAQTGGTVQSLTITERTTYQAMCEECRSISRRWDTPDEAVDELRGHHCEPVE